MLAIVAPGQGAQTPVVPIEATAALAMALLRKPVKPRYLPTVTVKMDGRNVPDEWRPYWSITLER